MQFTKITVVEHKMLIFYIKGESPESTALCNQNSLIGLGANFYIRHDAYWFIFYTNLAIKSIDSKMARGEKSALYRVLFTIRTPSGN
ncbi:hypothetical protein D3C81_1643360 [compost metagenome]